MRAQLLIVTLAALAATTLGGCVMKADMETMSAQIDRLKADQVRLKKQLVKEIDVRSERIAVETSELGASQDEFRAESDAISGQISQLGNSFAGVRVLLTELAHKVKALQNNQAIGLGSLSQRLDNSSQQLVAQIAAQGDKMDGFAQQVAASSTIQDEEIIKLWKGQAVGKKSRQKLDRSIKALSGKLDALGKKLTAEIAAVMTFDPGCCGPSSPRTVRSMGRARRPTARTSWHTPCTKQARTSSPPDSSSNGYPSTRPRGSYTVICGGTSRC